MSNTGNNSNDYIYSCCWVYLPCFRRWLQEKNNETNKQTKTMPADLREETKEVYASTFSAKLLKGNLSTGTLESELTMWAALQHPWEGSQGHHWDYLCKPHAYEFTSVPCEDSMCHPQGSATWGAIDTILEGSSHRWPLVFQAGTMYSQPYLRPHVESYLGYGKLINSLSINHLHSQRRWIKSRAGHLCYTQE